MSRRSLPMLTLCGCLLLAATAHAQVSLPSPVPQQLPTQQLPAVSPQSLPDTLDRTVERGTRGLVDLRRLQIRDLLREHRRVVDTDPDGAPVVRDEIVAIDPAPALLQQLAAAGFTVRDDSALDALQLRVVALRAPRGTSTRAALALARRLDPAGAYDYNHLFLRSAATMPVSTETAAMKAPNNDRNFLWERPWPRHTQAIAAMAAPTASDPGSSSDGAAFRVGLIDSGIDRTHPALAGTDIRAWGCGDRSTADAHGTAVASLLAGDAVAAPHGRATLYAADVYCAQPTGGAAVEVTHALAWLARERVGVVNISLVVPRNRLLERAIGRMIAQGHLIVAAVGNDGPAAPPLYPASYPGVVGVAAVNARNRVLPESARGAQVDFAAPGADMVAAAPARRWAGVRGTSYAAPLVARLAAQAMDAPGASNAEAALARLAQQAVVPARGNAEAYGRGVVGADLRMQRAPASSR